MTGIVAGCEGSIVAGCEGGIVAGSMTVIVAGSKAASLRARRQASHIVEVFALLTYAPRSFGGMMLRSITLIVVVVLVVGMGLRAAEASHWDATSQLQFELEDRCSQPIYNEDEIVAFASVVDCSITTETGYSSGEPFAIDVVQVDGKAVELDTANAFLVMQAAADADGVGLAIVSGFRSYAEQEYLYNCYLNCNCNNCNLAARPGYSNHNSGHALDLNASSPGVYSWLADNAAFFGFERTVPSENWHWEWWGGGPGGGVCGFSTSCPQVPPAGRVIEESDECFVAGGEREYLRKVEQGHGGELLWTKATDSASPANYAIWKLNFAEAGRYEVLVYTDDGEYGQSTQASYLVQHADGEQRVLLDQSRESGWFSLGTFAFSPNMDQSVRLDDNTGEPWSDDPGGVRLMFDALQIVPEAPPEGVGGGGDTVVVSDKTGDLVGGCSSTGQHRLSLWFVLATLVVLRRRPLRQRRRLRQRARLLQRGPLLLRRRLLQRPRRVRG